MNRAIDHVTRNLDAPLLLEEVARVACFSPFHFHRVFRAVVGETLHHFVTRLRLERAVHLMAHAGRVRLTDVALACGFAGSSDFSRAFKKAFGVPPRAFDAAAFTRDGRQRMVAALPDGHRLERLPPGTNPDGFEVQLRDVPSRRVAYLRVFRPYGGSGVAEAVTRMREWARAGRVEEGQWLGYQWDDPEIVPLDRCRYDVGVVVPDTTVVEGDVSAVRFPAMTLAEVAIRGPIELEMRAIDWLYTTWLPRSGLAPDHQPLFEAWDGEPFAHGTETFSLRLQLAVAAGPSA